MYSVRSYIYIYSVSSYLYSVTPYIYPVSSYLYSVTSYIYSISSYWYSVTSYICSVSSYLYFVYFIGGTVKLHTEDVVNKSVTFRATETSHYSDLKKRKRSV